MIPARLGSQRLQRKNLRTFGGRTLIAHAVQRCVDANCFDEIWVNSEAAEVEEIATRSGARFHLRPERLGDSVSTSEDFVAEFLTAHHCERVVQVHTIAPLLSAQSIRGFVERAQGCQTLFAVVEENLECLYRGKPLNFSLERKTNSQELEPIERICWAITSWHRDTFLGSRDSGCATYAGTWDTYPITRVEGHVIKTVEDLAMARALAMWPEYVDEP